jgi:hypothetical protein
MQNEQRKEKGVREMARGKKPAKTDGNAAGRTGDELDSQSATGNADKFVESRLIREIMNVLWLPDGLTKDQIGERALSAILMLQKIKPQDGIESLLAAQMVATHSAAMECLRRAMNPEHTLAGCDQNLKHAAKFLSIYMQQVGALDKRRGKGQQKVTVEYVNVQAGGQAIVGNVETNGRKRRQKSQGPAIEHAPEVPLETSVEQPATVKAATGKGRR